ncbi:hypothetical protein EDC44_101138 [Cricetibacter osteomyelitidis]|uniref:Uncharacterized protein n=1 Tax=Cricetibacter osteomyelitidis TaxID=1521931 RepID=A0A4R2T6K8_9PAST|nr:hypothetical protein [Cricetibacter osteomyelitidis]TCP97755.1 hypothetical protein EDC44_101138 [Cricetibacter osteomyelitidis]
MSILAKTFGGLSKSYYVRQFLFGLLFYALILFFSREMWNSGNIQGSITTAIFGLISLLLYPYSRFVYESIVEYIMGNNVFMINAILMLIVKFIIMLICFYFSIFIAPIGLLYLYFYHSKKEKALTQQNQD